MITNPVDWSPEIDSATGWQTVFNPANGRFARDWQNNFYFLRDAQPVTWQQVTDTEDVAKLTRVFTGLFDGQASVITAFYRCSKPECGKLTPLIGTAKGKCSSCGDEGGEVVPAELFRKRLNAGFYRNIDPNTGKAAKKKR